MLNMTESTKKFLEKYLPEALLATEVNDALDVLYQLIDQKGFNKDEEYNSFGRKAQEAYDDLYFNND